MIKIKNLTFGYGSRRDQPIFKSFNLEVQKGETVLITGINGTGKTTLLRLMAGALLPQSGTIEYTQELGEDPRAKIGFISDQMNLYEELTLSAAIQYHSQVYKISQFDMSLLEKTRLSLDKQIKDLSKGQKLIFHLGLILSSRPEILLIDEVIHSIDAYLREVFLKGVIELMAQQEMTVIMVNLNFHDIEKIPQRVILLRHGEIAVDEVIEDLKQKVKKVITRKEIAGDLPVLFSSIFADTYEYYLYPFEAGFREVLEGEVIDLNLNDIIKAFIGGEYV
jgi:ABC-type multidrug transport system ATPase subunit